MTDQTDFLAGSTVTQGKITVTVETEVDGGITWDSLASVA